MKPTEHVRPDATPLGLCHACAKVVYAGDRLAMAGVYLFHEGCADEGTVRAGSAGE
jgi:hypothetical protein